MSAAKHQTTRPAQPVMHPDKERRANIELLRQLLSRQLDLHTRLLECIDAKREAIRTADIDEVTALCQREQKIMTTLNDLEIKREPIVRHLATLLELHLPTDKAITSGTIAAELDEPYKGTLQALAAQLRDRIGEVKHAHSIVRQASDALNRHMTGVMQSVQAAMNKTGVYERRGRLAHATPVMRSVDLRS